MIRRKEMQAGLAGRAQGRWAAVLDPIQPACLSLTPDTQQVKAGFLILAPEPAPLPDFSSSMKGTRHLPGHPSVAGHQTPLPSPFPPCSSCHTLQASTNDIWDTSPSPRPWKSRGYVRTLTEPF